MIELTVNGIAARVPNGSTVLDAVRTAGVELPTLCHHDGLAPYGACRLCMVSVIQPSKGLAAACVTPADSGMIIDTGTPEAVGARRLTLEFLLARAPGSERIRRMAGDAGLTVSRFQGPDGAGEVERCILCGLCVRVCREAIGASAIEFMGRGDSRRVGAPFEIAADACIGCGACAEICPTGAIKIEDHGRLRIIHAWNTRIQRDRCPGCGRYFAPQPMAFVKDMFPEIENLWLFCPECRSKRTALIETVR